MSGEMQKPVYSRRKLKYLQVILLSQHITVYSTISMNVNCIFSVSLYIASTFWSITYSMFQTIYLGCSENIISYFHVDTQN